jgi:hypothetical protein
MEFEVVRWGGERSNRLRRHDGHVFYVLRNVLQESSPRRSTLYQSKITTWRVAGVVVMKTNPITSVERGVCESIF